MQIVKVRFIEDTQCAQTGWEFYPVGASAHFYSNQADWLVKHGRAVSGESPTPANPDLSPPAQLEVIEPLPDYSGMTVKQLKAAMVEAGLPVTSKMRKADLIAALEGK